ncbi:MAG: YkgJ family cysteine cluster protein [Acidobacteriia bacterium]|nr:YkgJ family cysteine cluster protein [Terriglobia bacterium]
MLTDLVQIQRLGHQKLKENQRFRVYLKTHNYSDRRLRRLAEQIESQIDCTQCANCCRVAEAGIKDRDIETLVKFLGVSPDEFRRDYTQRNQDDELILKRTEAGCVFLKDNLCTVYEARPRSCATFPNLVRGDGSIDSRMWRLIDRAAYCPIVYNWMEAVKQEMGFR